MYLFPQNTLSLQTSKLQIMKRLFFFLTLAALVFIGCRKESDYHPYIGETGDLAYDSYSSQFDYLWKCMSTGYVFWDVDETDWDAVYAEYMPKFQALDAKHEAGQDVTLYLANAVLPGREGLAFGLLAAALIPGYLLATL